MITFLAMLAGLAIGYVIGQILPLKERRVPIPATELHEMYRQQMRITKPPDLPPQP